LLCFSKQDGAVRTLRRLFAAGALTSYVQPSEEGPHRKYYGLNKTGRGLLAESTRTWNHFADTMSVLLIEQAARKAHWPERSRRTWPQVR